MECSKCGCTKFYTEQKGSQIGLYCSKCNKWVKWLSRKDYEAFKRTGSLVTLTREEHNASHSVAISDGKLRAQLEMFMFYLDKKIDKEMKREPLSAEDSIRKSSYCLALEQDKNAINNILHGKDFAEMQ